MENWKCPVCETKLVMSGQRQYETLDEHISHSDDPNYRFEFRDAYQCPTQTCEAYKNDVFWADDGSLYGGIGTDFENHCIDKNNAPFGSFARRINVEVYRVNHKEYTYLPAWFCLNFIRPYIEHKYKADVNGKVLSKKYKLKFLKKDEAGEYTLGFSPFWSNLYYKYYLKPKFKL